VHSAFINEIGSGADTIEFLGKYVTTTSLTYTTTSPSGPLSSEESVVYDNKVSIAISYYKNADADNANPDADTAKAAADGTSTEEEDLSANADADAAKANADADNAATTHRNNTATRQHAQHRHPQQRQQHTTQQHHHGSSGERTTEIRTSNEAQTITRIQPKNI
jgi:hypothetical protein